MPDRLTITIEADGEGVPAEALRVQLEEALRFLREGGEEGADWRVVAVSMNSPLRLELERRVPAGSPEPAERPGEELVRSFARMAGGEAVGEELSPRQVLSLQKMASPSYGVSRVEVRAGRGDAVELRPAWAEELKRLRIERKRAETPPEQPYSVTGRLEGVDVHGGGREFFVYDPLTDAKTRCFFPDEMMDEVGGALSQRVRVAGLAKFGPDFEPRSIRVSEFRPIPVMGGTFLERLDAAHARGKLDFTGGLSSEEAVEEVRHGTR